MKQVFGKSKLAKRANCNLKTCQTATLRAGLICNLRTRQIATLAAGAKAAPDGAHLVAHTPKKSTFGRIYAKPKKSEHLSHGRGVRIFSCSAAGESINKKEEIHLSDFSLTSFDNRDIIEKRLGEAFAARLIAGKAVWKK